MGATPTHHPPAVAAPSTTDSSLRTVSPQLPEVSAHAAALLHQAQLGDLEAFAELYRVLHAPVTAYMTRRMRDRDLDAEPDLVHDAFCHALAQLHTAPTDVRGWLIFLAATACISHHWSRRRHLSAAYAIHDQATRAEQSPTSTDVPARLDRARFAHALVRLTPDQRRAIQLRYLDGYPPRRRRPPDAPKHRRCPTASVAGVETPEGKPATRRRGHRQGGDSR